MAFYGNITNTSQTTFQFDRIYSNRLEMEVNCPNDGIFVGRYVLVEYDDEAAFPIVYKINNKFYTTPKEDANTQIKYGGTTRPASESIYSSLNEIYLNEIVQTQLANETIQFYKCTGENNGIAVFEHLNKDVTSTNNYIRNFAIDEQHYNPNEEKNDKWKGFDSTVWVKTTVTINGKLYTKYVWIADLNSVVPTFDVAADAPTMEPLIPHFDSDSTNVYYKLHLQSPYGLRVKAGTEGASDATTYWIREKYDASTGKTKKQYYDVKEKTWVNYDNIEQIKTLAADIYYNQAAFKPQVDTSRTSENGINKHADSDIVDKIEILPTGQSDQTYYDHNSGAYQKANDIQEISIHLPAIGNMMSDAWDIIHGPNRNDSMNQFDENGNRIDSLQGRLDSIAAIGENQIPVKKSDTGALVGTTINKDNQYSFPEGVNDILDVTSENLPQEFQGDDAWVKTKIDTSRTDNDCISIRHTFHKVSDSASEFDKNTHEFNTDDNFQKDKILLTNEETAKEDYDTIKLYTPYVDAMGHVVGKNIETVILPYSYKTITTNGREDEKEDINTDAINASSIVADNTQDTLAINSGNKWIRIDTSEEENKNILTISHDVHTIDTAAIEEKTNKNSKDEKNPDEITIQDLTFDVAGHVTGNKEHTYILPYGFKTVKVENSSNAAAPATGVTPDGQSAENTQDTLILQASNTWIKLSDIKDDIIRIGHCLKTYNTSSDTKNLSNDKEASTFEIYDDSFDEAGHVNKRKTITVTMPTGYNTIVDDNNTKTTAKATTDTLAITGDSWLQTTANNNVLNITHIGPVAGDTNSTTISKTENITSPSFGGTFKIPIVKYDSKGHITSTENYDITIPKNSLIDNQTEDDKSEVITKIELNDTEGKFTTSRTKVGTLQLTNYSPGTDTNDITNTDTINGAFAKLQGQITNEKKRINTILTGEDDLDDTINTFKELQEYIAAHGKEAADMAASINNEISRAQGAETALGARIDNLDSEKNAAQNKYISGIKQVDGVITEITETLIPIRAIVTGSSNGTISVNGSDVDIKGLGSAAYTESTDYLTKDSTFTYGEENNKTIQDLMTIVYDQATEIANLKDEIKALELKIRALESQIGE